MKTELEKCLAGEPFYGGDTEIVKIAAKAKRLTRELNDTGYTDIEKKRGIMKQLFGSVGRRVHIDVDFHCEYGRHIFIGDRVIINMNCTFVDNNIIEIGNDVLIASNVQIYTATHSTRYVERMLPDEGKPPQRGFCRRRTRAETRHCGRGPGERRRSAGHSLCREIRSASHVDARVAFDRAARGLRHSERAQMPSARQPQSGAGGNCLLHALSDASDRIARTQGAFPHGTLRLTGPDRTSAGRALGPHARARSRGERGRADNSGRCHLPPLVPLALARPEGACLGGLVLAAARNARRGHFASHERKALGLISRFACSEFRQSR